MRDFWRVFLLSSLAVLTSMALMAFATLALAEESVSFYFSHVDDGGCAVPARAVEGEYVSSGGPFEALASVRVAPSGGDCETQAVAYNLELERSFGGYWLTKFVAAENAAASTYGLAQDGELIQRGDGGPLFATNLPAGTAKTVAAIIGTSRPTPFGEFDLGVNLVPVDWADGDSGNTLHGAWSNSFGAFDLSFRADVGQDSFGSARAAWSRGIATIKLGYDFGLNAVDDGSPAVQYVNGAEFLQLGSPQDDRVSIGVGLTWSVD